MKSPEKRATCPVPITVKSESVFATEPAGQGGGADFSDSGSDSGSGAGEELLTLEPRADGDYGGKPNPWARVEVTRVTTPPPIEVRHSYLRRSEDVEISAPSGQTVFEGISGMRRPVEGKGEGGGLLDELEDKLKQATLSLTEAEREYIMEFGELPE